MTEDERYLDGLIFARMDIAFKHLKRNPEYLEQLQIQAESEKQTDEILRKLSDEDRRAVNRHSDGEVAKQCLELPAVYLQGLRDCVRLLRSLEFFGSYS